MKHDPTCPPFCPLVPYIPLNTHPLPILCLLPYFYNPLSPIIAAHMYIGVGHRQIRMILLPPEAISCQELFSKGGVWSARPRLCLSSGWHDLTLITTAAVGVIAILHLEDGVPSTPPHAPALAAFLPPLPRCPGQGYHCCDDCDQSNSGRKGFISIVLLHHFITGGSRGRNSSTAGT